ncbi:unnamed protein product [Heligmosomoides polygyrus]|uniref:RH2 domain-containing protein n=1 Tax=Heligmosomoides polygyrus TaxID=6339 RepID=A0A183G935_HELPZ|nr:unnamed protein product [Heligmosomoides polygyrus]
MDEELLKVEMEVARKERENLELASSNEMRKLKIRMSQMSLMRSQQRISYLRRRRKELEEEQKRLSILVEQENAFWTEKLQSAREKQARFQEIMDRSPRLAKLRSEQEAVKTLTTRVEQLTLENDELKKEAARLEKELELETAAPMRVFVVNFAKVALRIYEMRDKLAEARRINKQLQAEEAEMRQKMGAANYDMFDTTFMSQDMALTKVPEHTALSTEVPKVALPATLPEAAEEENASVGASNISDGSHTSQLQLPQTTEQDVLVARANAVNNYVVQQAESVARANEPQDNDSGEMTRDEDERESVHNREPEQCPGVDIEVTSVADEERAQIQEDVDMNGTVEEHDAVLQEQEIEPGDFSDDDGSAMDATTEDVEQNATMDEDDNEEPTSPFMPKVDRIETQAATKSPMSLAKESPQMKASSQRIAASSQMSQQSQHDAVDVRTPGLGLIGIAVFLKFFCNFDVWKVLLCESEVNFNFNVNGDNNDFDPTEVLNISTNSNDPGADFLSLMKSENEKKEKQRKGSGAGAADFSFSVFGMPAEGGSTEGGGGFDFNFGDSTQGCEGGGGSFQFNFGESTDDQGTTGGGGGGFNLFGF